MTRSTGIIRRMDDLGRIIIPKAVRRELGFEENDAFEILLDKSDGSVTFRRWQTDWDKVRQAAAKEGKPCYEVFGCQLSRDTSGCMSCDGHCENALARRPDLVLVAQKPAKEESNRITVSTPLGTLDVYKSCDDAHPGVYIDLLRESLDGDSTAPLAMVEFSGDEDREPNPVIITRVWDDVRNENGHKIVHRGIDKFFGENG